MTTDHQLLIGLLLGQADDAVPGGFTRTMREEGHQVEVAASGEELLAGGPFDAVVLDATLPGQWSGLGLLEALRASGEAPVVLLVGDPPDFPSCRRAMQLGVADFVPRPFTTQDLAQSLGAAVALREGRAEHLMRSLPATRESVALGARAVAAFLLERGVAPTHRMRISSAVAEVLYLCCREPQDRATRERVVLRAYERSERVEIEIETQGPGLECLTLIAPALPGFPIDQGQLERARSLSEALAVHPTPGGSRMRLSFELNPVRFEQEPDELAELDYLHPETTHEWLSRLVDGTVAVPAVMTATLGRLMAGARDASPSFQAAWR